MIIVHHLNFSRSTRVLWALEELGLDYELKSYQRDANFRAPPELKAVHPLGKAPVIEDGDLMLAESSTILTYINAVHGGGRLAPPAGTKDAALHDEWLQYSESSAAFPIMTTLIGGVSGGLPDGMKAFVAPELAKTVAYLEQGVTAGPYLMGEMFTLADIQLSYLLHAVDRAGLLRDRPALTAYLARIEERPAFARAIEKGGPMVRPKG